MNAERLLTHYEKIADTPDAIARLRRFVLDLAVRGKLVPQDTKDEPASELLRRLASAETQIGKRGKARGQEILPAPNLEQSPFDLPLGWAWARFPELGTFGRGKSKHRPRNDPALFVGGKHLMIQTGDVARSQGLIKTYTGMYNDLGLAQSLKWPKGTLCITIAANIADSGILSFDACFPDSVVGFIPSSVFKSARYFEYFVRTAKANLLEFAPATAQKNINLEILTQVLIPLPPIAEQHRIVAKVDELIALCDRLEKSMTAREEVRDRLTAASLARLNDPDPDTFQADTRIALYALPSITARPDQIKQLRQTILNLAVRGMLVPQDPNNEAASILLARVNKTRQVRRAFAEIDEAQPDYALPDIPTGWTWTTIDQCSADDENAITDGPFGSQLKTEHYISAAGFRVIRLQNIGSGDFRAEHTAYIEQSRFERLVKHHVKAGDLVVAGLVDPRVRCCEVPADVGPALVKADCYRFSVHPSFSSRFALHYLNSPVAQAFASAHHHGMTLTRIGLGNFRRVPFPLPPVAEQTRIVAKVDELMALCDRLEASTSNGEKARSRLLDALLHEALEPVADRLEAAA